MTLLSCDAGDVRLTAGTDEKQCYAYPRGWPRELAANGSRSSLPPKMHCMFEWFSKSSMCRLYDR